MTASTAAVSPEATEARVVLPGPTSHHVIPVPEAYMSEYAALIFKKKKTLGNTHADVQETNTLFAHKEQMVIANEAFKRVLTCCFLIRT